MSTTEFILNNLGMMLVKPKLYRPSVKYPEANDPEFKPDVDEAKERMDGDLDPTYSWMGTPVWANITLSDPATDTSLTIDQILCEVRNGKNIVKTQVQGLAGTVKEFISKGDYTITLRGGLFSENQFNYPTDAVNTLIALCEADNDLDVISDFMSLFSIYNIVITGFRFIQQQGKQNSQLFEITALSDTSVQLKLDEQS